MDLALENLATKSVCEQNVGFRHLFSCNLKKYVLFGKKCKITGSYHSETVTAFHRNVNRTRI